MSFVLKPWQLWIVAVAGWINQQQQEVKRSVFNVSENSEMVGKPPFAPPANDPFAG